MIPRNLTDVTWTDIQKLIDLGREEDDTIEFKRSFKGGDDYAALNDRGREQALDAIAREAIAFLNTRGGDIIIGVAEAVGPHPKAELLTPVRNPADAAERLACGLSALIEPAQTNINARAITNPEDSGTGAIVIRVQASVRAPHRSRRSLECYARRGSESVPMAMDEIQDTTINRNRLRLEQLDFVDRQFADFIEGRAEHRHLGEEVLHIRVCVAPLLDQSLPVTEEVLNAVSGRDPVFYDARGNAKRNDVAFRNLHSRWVPVLRGMKRENFIERIADKLTDFQYARKVVKTSGVCIFDYAVTSHFRGEIPVIHSAWIIGFLAEVFDNLRTLGRMRPSVFPATVRTGIRSLGEIHLEHGSDRFPEHSAVPEDIIFFPDFVINSEEDLDALFKQVQIDLYSVINVAQDEPYSLVAPSEGATAAQNS